MERWWESTNKLFALDKEQRCKFMILMRGPCNVKTLAAKIGVKESTVSGWESRGKFPRMDHLQALLLHFSDWYVDKGLPQTLAAALAEITEKKDLTSEKKPVKKATQYETAEE